MGKHKRRGTRHHKGDDKEDAGAKYSGPRTEETNGLKDFQILPTEYGPSECPYAESTDPDFPTNNNSLGKMFKKTVKKWERKTCNLYDTIDASDIQQGLLGDCFFLSAIAAIAEVNPKYIERMFLQDKKDEGWMFTDTYHNLLIYVNTHIIIHYIITNHI